MILERRNFRAVAPTWKPLFCVSTYAPILARLSVVELSAIFGALGCRIFGPDSVGNFRARFWPEFMARICATLFEHLFELLPARIEHLFESPFSNICSNLNAAFRTFVRMIFLTHTGCLRQREFPNQCAVHTQREFPNRSPVKSEREFPNAYAVQCQREFPNEPASAFLAR